jgi:hypothetical protein
MAGTSLCRSDREKKFIKTAQGIQAQGDAARSTVLVVLPVQPAQDFGVFDLAKIQALDESEEIGQRRPVGSDGVWGPLGDAKPLKKLREQLPVFLFAVADPQSPHNGRLRVL